MHNGSFRAKKRLILDQYLININILAWPEPRRCISKKKERTMKKLIIILLVFNLHSIVIANEGTVFKMLEIVEVGNVVVKPSTEYDVDLNGYQIPEEARLLIFHILDSPGSHYYFQELKAGKLIYKMNSKTLKAAKGAPPFKGLKKGDGAFLIIGSEVQPGSIDMGILYSNESIAVIVRE